MAPIGKMYFVFVFVSILTHCPPGCHAGVKHFRQFPGGEFAPCELCWLGRGKCRKMCLEEEKIVGNCKRNFFCCRQWMQ